jgi:outer membrane protein OmpA-like peptidoglycan-associated protein
MHLHVKGPSNWHYATGGGQNVSVDTGLGPSLSAAAGHLTLTSPEGNDYTFHFKVCGGGAGVGSLKKLGPISSSQSFEAMWSQGLGKHDILIGEGVTARELSPTDFEGFCIVQEASLSFGAGVSGTLFYLGIPLSRLPLAILSETGLIGSVPDMPGGSEWLDVVAGPLGSWLAKKAIHAGHLAPKAILRIAGASSGWQAGLGASVSTGLVTWDIPWTWVFARAPVIDVPASTDQVGIRSKSGQQVELVIKGDVLFNFDDDHFKTEATKPPLPTPKERNDCDSALETIRKAIQDSRPRSIAVWGYTDSFGPQHHNATLSQDRADYMREWLIRKAGYAGKVLSYGAGATEFVASPGGTRDQQQANRRVVLYLFYS